MPLRVDFIVKTEEEQATPNNAKPDVKPRSVGFYVILGAALFAFIHIWI